MKNRNLKSWLVVLALTLPITYTIAQNDRPIEERIESQRIAFITQRVNLTPEEAQAFWPIYNEYREKEQALKAARRSKSDVIDMDEAEASDHINHILELEQQELDLKKTYTVKLRQVISAKKIIRFYSAEQMFKERLLQIMSQRRKSNRN